MRGEIDEQFERRARLAAGLGGAVERARLVALAADHRDDPAIGAHRRPSPPAHRRVRRWRRRGPQAAADRRRAWSGPSPRHSRRRTPFAPSARPSRRNRCRSGPWPIGAPARPIAAARARTGVIAPVSAISWSTSRLRFCAPERLRVGASRDGAWTMPASIADWARLRFSGAAVEIMAGGGAQAIDAIAEIDRSTGSARGSRPWSATPPARRR